MANLPEVGETFEINHDEEYLRKYFPRLTGDEHSVDDKFERDELRKTMRWNFIKPGCPGAKFKSAFDKMLKCLTLPKPVRESLGVVGGESLASFDSKPDMPINDPTQNTIIESTLNALDSQREVNNEHEKQMLRKCFQEGYYHLVPSFFKMLIHLKKQKQEFSVVFRTFGSDLENVVLEFNKFCQGEHPCFNGKNGTPNFRMDGHSHSKDFRFKNYNT